MSTDLDQAVRDAARRLASDPGPEAERSLLQALAARMIKEESSFDPAHGLARIVAASDGCGEVRLAMDGAWKIGSAPEQDLVAIWGTGAHPPLAALLEGVQEQFSSAKVSALVGEVKELVAR